MGINEVHGIFNIIFFLLHCIFFEFDMAAALQAECSTWTNLFVHDKSNTYASQASIMLKTSKKKPFTFTLLLANIMNI